MKYLWTLTNHHAIFSIKHLIKRLIIIIFAYFTPKRFQDLEGGGNNVRIITVIRRINSHSFLTSWSKKHLKQDAEYYYLGSNNTVNFQCNDHEVR
jgi:hypothetical protein